MNEYKLIKLYFHFFNQLKFLTKKKKQLFKQHSHLTNCESGVLDDCVIRHLKLTTTEPVDL